MKKAMMTAVMVVCVSRAWGVTPTADEKPLRHALQTYLSKQGNVCLGKFDWPIEVSDSDFKDGTRNAVQMPVLEKLGLVASSAATAQRRTDDGTETVTVKRFELTGAGRKFYLPKDAITRGPGDMRVEHHKDFCAARVSLDQVVRWDESTPADGVRQGTLLYTYHVAVADWARSPDVLKVFPMIDRVVWGEGTLQLAQHMQHGKKGWVAVATVD